jgi:hypothetical protein
MWGSFLAAALSRRTNGRRRRGQAAPEGRRPALEALESRDLLNFTPMSVLEPVNGGIGPQSTPAPTGYTPAQMRHAYGIDQISFNGVTGDGTGETIAIVDAYRQPNIASDLHQFDLAFGLPDPPSFTEVDEHGGNNLPAPSHVWGPEISLDVEWAHAIAPKANIVLVDAANDYNNADMYQAVQTAANYPGVVVVSMSWGSGEYLGETNDDANFVTPAGHSGVTFVASAGDSGAPPIYPAISPNVLSIGGTTLALNSAGNILGETAWSGGGGGVSIYESQPTYQQGAYAANTTMRFGPDVAWDANPATGVPVYDTYDNSTSAPWGQWGGTSIGAPQWSALIAIADQGRSLASLAPLDGRSQVLPVIYNLPGSNFHDITGGTTTGTPNYTAAVGYDLATGLGSPVGNVLAASLQGNGLAAWSDLGNQAISTATGVTAGGTREIFIIARNHFLYEAEQNPNGSWGAWNWLGGGCAGPLAVAENSSGYLDAYVIGQDGQTWFRDQTAPGTFAGWAGLGGACAALAAGTNADGSEQVFVVGADGALYTNLQTGSVSWTGWQSLGGGCKPVVAVARDTSGYLDAFVLGQDSQVWFRDQTSRDNFAGWGGLGGDCESLAVGTNADGSEQIFVVNPGDNQLYTRVQASAGGTWNQWEGLGGGCAGPVTVALDSYGYLTPFVTGQDGQVYYRTETARSVFNGWGGLSGYASLVTAGTNPDGSQTVFLVTPTLAQVWARRITL